MIDDAHMDLKIANVEKYAAAGCNGGLMFVFIHFESQPVAFGKMTSAVQYVVPLVLLPIHLCVV